MYFLRYQPLKEKLRARLLSDKEALPYLALLCGLAAAATFFSSSESFNAWDWAGGALSVMLAFSGVFYAYSKNGGSDGFDFIQKYIVIGWIASVRWTLVFIPLVIGFSFAVASLGDFSDETKWYEVVFIGFLEAILYQRIGRHIADTK